MGSRGSPVHSSLGQSPLLIVKIEIVDVTWLLVLHQNLSSGTWSAVGESVVAFWGRSEKIMMDRAFIDNFINMYILWFVPSKVSKVENDNDNEVEGILECCCTCEPNDIQY